jgi:ribosomal protein L11 methyltransferase
MPTYVARISAPKADAEMLADRLAEMLDPPPAVGTGEGPEGWVVEAYFTEPPDRGALAAVADSLPHLSDLRGLRLEAVPDEDWVARTQRGLHPIEAGRFFVHGSHDRDAAKDKPFAIEIDAGQAFGTAHHGTTRGCLILLDRLAKKESIGRVLDLGAGSGVLAIAAAKALHAPVIASDIDPIATRVAHENIAHNGMAAFVKTVTADGVDSPAIRGEAPFDLVMANILAGPLIAIAPDIAKLLPAGGHLILSGLLDSQAREVLGRYRGQGFRLAAKLSLEGWTSMHLRRLRIRRQPH